MEVSLSAPASLVFILKATFLLVMVGRSTIYIPLQTNSHKVSEWQPHAVLPSPHSGGFAQVLEHIPYTWIDQILGSNPSYQDHLDHNIS